MKLLLLLLFAFTPMFCIAQDSSKKWIWNLDSIKTSNVTVDTSAIIHWTNTIITYDSLFIPKKDTIKPYNVIYVDKHGVLKMVGCKYLILEYNYVKSIIGIAKCERDDILGIYSYEDEYGIHCQHESIIHCYKKGENRVNWHSEMN